MILETESTSSLLSSLAMPLQHTNKAAAVNFNDLIIVDENISGIRKYVN
jgi:hypothetical protein